MIYFTLFTFVIYHNQSNNNNLFKYAKGNYIYVKYFNNLTEFYINVSDTWITQFTLHTSFVFIITINLLR